jgi:hypothetical protein
MKKSLMVLVILGLFTGASFAQAPAAPVTANAVVADEKAPEQGVKKGKKVRKHHKAKAEKKAERKVKKEQKVEAAK